MPADTPLTELATGPEARKAMLETVLLRRLNALIEGQPFTWKDLLVGLTLGGQPVSLFQVKHWLKTDWGQAVWAELQGSALETARDVLDGEFVAALKTQLNDAQHACKASDRAFAYSNVLRTAKELGYLADASREAEGKRPDIALLVKVYADPIALARNVTPTPQTLEPPQLVNSNDNSTST